jgi:hypothetical protein
MWMPDQPDDRLPQLLRVRRIDRHARVNCLGDPRVAAEDDGDAMEHRLGDDHSERLGA